MGLRDRLRKLTSTMEADLETYWCGGCAETFRIPGNTWMDLLVIEWAQGVRERGGDPGQRLPDEDEHTATLIEHIEHAGVIRDASGAPVWTPRSEGV